MKGILMIDVENDEDGIEYYIKCGYSEDDAKFLYEYLQGLQTTLYYW